MLYICILSNKFDLKQTIRVLHKMPLDKMPKGKMPVDKTPVDKMHVYKKAIDTMPVYKKAIDKMTCCHDK